jgi:6-phosphofructokinase 1
MSPASSASAARCSARSIAATRSRADRHPARHFDYSDRVVEMFGKMELDALVCIGGDGTLAISYEFYKKGIPLVCVPKTIDNDIVGTTSCFGFDTAVSFATDAIDRLHSTAEAHRRIMVVEVMGRYAGWIALHSGMAGGADVILIPEIPYDLERVAACIRDATSSARASALWSSPKAPIQKTAASR